MKSKLTNQIRYYKELIEDEFCEHIICEMLYDLKKSLLETRNDIETNYRILETFHNIKDYNMAIDELTKLEDILTENSGISISNIKVSFMNKHEKIIDRDKKWLNSNKKKILALDYEGIELEVLSDYKVTFEQLLNRHNIFDKVFTDNKEGNLSDKLRRFEDKNDNLKNGLDNYFRTGTSRREIGLRKVRGEDAKFAVENMVAYCESFLAGKQFLEEKMNSIIVAINDASVKESLTPIETLRLLLEKDDSALKEIENASKDITKTTGKKDSKEKIEEEPVEEKPKKEAKPKEEPIEKEKPEEVSEEEPVEDDLDEEPAEDTAGEEESDESEEPSEERGIEDRQIGVAVLLTVAEERYFDYINILKGLIEE